MLAEQPEISFKVVSDGYPYLTKVHTEWALERVVRLLAENFYDQSEIAIVVDVCRHTSKVSMLFTALQLSNTEYRTKAMQSLVDACFIEYKDILARI